MVQNINSLETEFSIPNIPVVDFHAHAFPDKIAGSATELLAEHYKLKVSCPGTLDHLLQSSREAGVVKICLHMAATNAEQVQIANDWIADKCSDSLIGFGSIHVDYKDCLSELDRMESLGLTGVKLHADFQGFAIDNPRMWPIYDAIGERFLIMFHVGDRKSDLSNPYRLGRVLTAFPRLKAVAAHLGGWSRWVEAREHILGKDIYIDTSSTTWMLQPGEIAELIKLHDENRVLFGTDYPIVTPKEELKEFLKVPLSAGKMEKILWKNAENLLEEFKNRRNSIDTQIV